MSTFAQKVAPKIDQSTTRLMTNDLYFSTRISKVSDRNLFFPAPRLYQIECTHDASNGSCIFGKNDIFNATEDNIEEQILRMRISHDAQIAPHDIKSYWVKSVSTDNVTKFDEDYDGVDGVTCTDNFVSTYLLSL